MGQGGELIIVNGTNSSLNLTAVDANGMHSWNFPQNILPFTTASVFIEFNTNTNVSDNNGGSDISTSVASATYLLANETDRTHDTRHGQTTLQFSATASPFHQLSVTSSVSNRVFTEYLEWTVPSSTPFHGVGIPSKGRKIGFVIAGSYPHYFINNREPAANWMTSLVSTFPSPSPTGTFTLRELCLPGSHNAGMNELIEPTLAATSETIQTQSATFYNQLMHGCRYFDIHPVLSNDTYSTGNYIYHDKHNSWQGAKGQSINSIIHDLNNFTTHFHELIILHLSNDHNLDKEGYPSLEEVEYQTLFRRFISQINHLYITHGMPIVATQDLSLLPLAHFITGHASVLVFVDCPSSFIEPFAHHGIYSTTKSGSLATLLQNTERSMVTVPRDAFFPVHANGLGPSIFHECSQTADVLSLVNSQLMKMKEFSHYYEVPTQLTNVESDDLFMLKWILEVDSSSHTEEQHHHMKSLRDLAIVANPVLFETLLPTIDQEHYPNIIMLDYFDQSSYGVLALAINLKLAYMFTHT
jgi:hypothetical protein